MVVWILRAKAKIVLPAGFNDIRMQTTETGAAHTSRLKRRTAPKHSHSFLSRIPMAGHLS